MKLGHRQLLVLKWPFGSRRGAQGSIATLCGAAASVYSSGMAATPVSNPANPPSAPPAEGAKRATRPPDRRLRLEDILKLMVADGLISAADGGKSAPPPPQRFQTPPQPHSRPKQQSL